MTAQQTTASLQTPPGKGGIAVIALSGPKATEILTQAFAPFASHTEAPLSQLQLGHLRDGDETIDQAVVCRTEQGAEINIHGGPHVARRAMELLTRLGATPEPCRQGALPLAHPQWNNPAIGAELLATLPKARSELVVRALSFQWSAGLSKLVCSSPTSQTLRQAAQRYIQIQRLLHPPQVVLAGPPNAGKSTLANALVGRQVSIVHQQAGTTRDWVQELALINGIPVWLTDTAGLWEEAHGIDAEAVRRARHRAETADLVLLLAPGQSLKRPDWLADRPTIHVASKADSVAPCSDADITISTQTGEGLDNLRSAILQAIGLNDFTPNIPMAFTHRQADLLNQAATALDSNSPQLAKDALSSILK